MISLGINKGITHFGKKLKDGGAALISDSRIISAISEERLKLIKGAGGYEDAVLFLLEKAGLSIKDIDIITFSSCCEYNPEIDNNSTSKLFPSKKIIKSSSHHFSHAASAFFTSGFDKALIIVNDSGGDVLDSMSDNFWWKYRREQATYYIATDSRIEKIGVDFENPLEAGIGEIFRAFTKFLGWNTKYTGKVMSLAGTISESKFTNSAIWEITKNEKIISPIENSPNSPISMVKSLGEHRKLILPSPREFNSAITREHTELAFWVQSEYEKIICKKIETLTRKYNTKNLCLSGGVALNCVANSKILANTEIENLYIQPAAGDQGQCLGNAIYGLHHLGIKAKFDRLSPYLSPAVFVSKHLIESNKYFLPNFELIHLKRPELSIASLVNSSKIVGHFYGQGEFGPRALGHRSIFASPVNANMKKRINVIKNRESFNPFACTILENHYSTWFYSSAESSKYMLLADKVKPEFRQRIPAILHDDNTSRVQTITPTDSLRVFEIINQFYQLTGVPLLLNTSLNSNNQPICESITDALKTFANLNLDCLIIDNYLILLKDNRDEFLSIIDALQN
ncbi:MAG: hypothetical protein JNK91_07415 [Ferruginibacter sp.]|nr:hypothetical protein [Ferruginibacter sp.]